ncbi:MAG: hypothetical protein WCL71_11905, partial [Deltaproteobacteria bacterium]
HAVPPGSGVRPYLNLIRIFSDEAVPSSFRIGPEPSKLWVSGNTETPTQLRPHQSRLSRLILPIADLPKITHLAQLD